MTDLSSVDDDARELDPVAPPRDAEVLRRAVRAGTWTFVGLAAITFAANLAFGGDGAAAVVWVTASFTAGTIVASGWMVMALLADMVAGLTPTRRRTAWTAALFALGFVSPILPAAALLAAAGGA